VAKLCYCAVFLRKIMPHRV